MLIRESRLYFTIGAQRSGKSTLAREWLHRKISFAGEADDGFPRFLWDSDLLRLELYGYRYHHGGESMTFAIKRYAIATALRAGHDVIVAGTHTSKTSIRRILEIRKNALPVLVDTPLAICQERAIATDQADLLPVIERVCRQIDDLKQEGIGNVIKNILQDMELRKPQ